MLKDSIELYYKLMPLKKLLRSGFVLWKVDADRIESVAEHSWSCCLLALTVAKEMKIDIDIEKVLKMLTLHEFEEVCIGDLTPYDKKDRNKEAERAREFFANNLKLDAEFIDIIDEFNERKTKEARFAKMIDYLDATLMTKYYQDQKQASLDVLKSDPALNDKVRKVKLFAEKIDAGYDLSDLFYFYGQDRFEEFGIDENVWFDTIKKVKVLDSPDSTVEEAAKADPSNER